jgi:hypothetical protein
MKWQIMGWSSIPSYNRDFYIYQHDQTDSGAYQASYPVGTWGSRFSIVRNAFWNLVYCKIEYTFPILSTQSVIFEKSGKIWFEFKIR